MTEFLDGGSLLQRLQKGHPQAEETSAILLPIAAALDALHRRQIVHGCVRPSNILFRANGQPVLVDGGIHGDVDRVLEKVEREHWPPEWRLESRSDVYSLGVVVYRMLTGTTPFPEDNSNDRPQTRREHPVSLRHYHPALSQSVDHVIWKALAYNPEDRFATAGEFARQFQDAIRSDATWPTG